MMLFHHSSQSVCKDDISLSCRQGMKSCQLPVNSFILETTARWMHISYISCYMIICTLTPVCPSSSQDILPKDPAKHRTKNTFQIFFLTFNSKFFKLFLFFTGAIISFHRSILQICIDRFCVGPCWLFEQYITAATILFSGSWAV